MQCDECGKRFSGSGLSVVSEGKQKVFCADCYRKIREEYDKKRICDDCSHFDHESCELTGSKLKPISIGDRDYFVQAEECVNYTDEETRNAQETIENLRKAGRYEEAAQECEKLRMLEKAGQLRRKGKEVMIANLEKAGRYEEAALECEKLGMLEKAGQLRRKGKEVTVLHIDVNSLIRQMADRGQTLTYHCCHCGAPLRVGAKSEEVFKICPNCGYSLEVIDLAKLINQHLS
jgi:hypothetical protein